MNAYLKRPTAAGKETLRRLRAAKTMWHGPECTVLSRLDAATNYEFVSQFKLKPLRKR